MFRSALLFVLFNVAVKISLRKLNGFDALSVSILVSANVKPFLHESGYIVEIALIGIVMSALAHSAGASRKGMLFISGVFVVSDVLVESTHLVGEIEGLEECGASKIGATAQATLLMMVLYATLNTEEDQATPQSEMQSWIALILASSALRSALVSYRCENKNQVLPDLASFARIIVLVSACTANGADETAQEEDI